MAGSGDAPYGSPGYRTVRVGGRHVWRLEREAEELAAQKLAEAESRRRQAEEEKGELASPAHGRQRHRFAPRRRPGKRTRPRRERRQRRQVTASR